MNLEVSNPLLGTVHDRDHTYRTLNTLCNVDSCVVRLLRFARTLKMTVNSCYCNRCNIYGLVVVPLIEKKVRGVIQKNLSLSFASVNEIVETFSFRVCTIS